MKLNSAAVFYMVMGMAIGSSLTVCALKGLDCRSSSNIQNDDNEDDNNINEGVEEEQQQEQQKWKEKMM
jgi:hypothetical protein